MNLTSKDFRARPGDKISLRDRLIVSQIVLDVFDELRMAYPATTAKRRWELSSIRKRF